jgi:signal transduction histidine kinase
VLVVFVSLQVFGVIAQRGVDRAGDRAVRLARDIEQIRYYDELLTMSARLAAATGDMSYEQRYRDAVPKLDLVIADAFTLVPDSTARAAVSETDAANRALVALEESSLRLLAAGDRAASYEQLTGSRYVELKALYAKGMNVALTLLEEAETAATNRSNRQQTGSLVAGGLAAAGVGLMWFRSTVGLNRSRGRLKNSGESKNEFLAGVSHELRTPLTAVVGYSSILRSDWASMDDGEHQELVALIHQQSTEMAHIVEDLLVATRLDHGELTVSRLTVQMAREIESVLAALPVPDQSTLVVSVPDSIGVIGDPSRIRQVVRNLITNAYRYGGTSIVVDATNINNTSVLSVTDNGPGLPREEWELVFEPYYRSHNRTGLTDSVGLGLTVSRRLAREMGGDLVYRGTDLESVFSLSLPAASTVPVRPTAEAVVVSLTSVADS